MMLARTILVGALAIGWLACAKPLPEHSEESPSRSGTAAAPSGSARSAFGDPLDPATPYVELAALRADPANWNGKRVRTTGKIEAVCQSAGCWADLQPMAGANGVPVHVNMHGHAFFLPKTSKGKTAEVEGKVEVRALSTEQVEHFNSEGASLTAGAPMVVLDASGVALAP